MGKSECGMRNAEFGYVISDFGFRIWDLGLRIYKMDFIDFTFLNPSLNLINLHNFTFGLIFINK